MTGIEAINSALKILGYENDSGNVKLEQRIKKKATVSINLIYADLYKIVRGQNFTPVSSLAERIDLPDNVLFPTFIYGLAMKIAQSENDGDQQQTYAYLYNQKRLSLSHTEKRKDIFDGSCCDL